MLTDPHDTQREFGWCCGRCCWQLTTIPVAFPASPAVVNAVSFWITQTQQPGTLLEQGPSEVQVRRARSLLTAPCSLLTAPC